MVSLKTKILGYKHDFVRFKNNLITNLKKSGELSAFLEVSGNILLFGFLGGMTYLAFTSPTLWVKFLGIGCGLVLFKEQLYDLIVGILSSITFSKRYG